MRLKFLQELDIPGKVKEPWKPTEEESKAKKWDEMGFQAMLDERRKVEPSMMRAAKSWNLLSARVKDPRISNVLLPIGRMICRQIISSITEGMPGYNYKPRGKSDYAKVDLWKAANEHADSACNMQVEMEDFATNLVVLGNAGLEDFLHLPTTLDRRWVGDKWEENVVRDFSRPRIGTRSRHPMEFAFATWGKDPNGRVPKMWRDFYSWNEFVDLIGNAKDEYGEWKFINVEHVVPGYSSDFSGTDLVTKYTKQNHDGVAVITLQDPIRNRLVRYANGVLITRPKDDCLKEYSPTGRPTLSVATNHHVYESNYRSSQAWGVGEMHLIAGLDALYQAMGNLTIDNFKLANINLVSVKGGNQSALDPDISYLSGMRVDGEVIVSPMGTVRLGDYQAFKVMIDEMCMALTGFNFKQLAGDTSKTAFEFQQRLRAQSQELEHKVRKLENSCLKAHGEVRLSFILKHMTVEEYEDIREEDAPAVKDLLKEGRVAREDYEFDKGKPVRRLRREKVTVKGYRIKEEFDKKGRRRKGGLIMEKAPVSSDVSVVGEYFWPAEYVESGAIPDVEVVGKTMHNLERDLKFQKLQFMANYARQRVAEAVMNPQVEALQTDLSPKAIDEELVLAVDLPKDSVMPRQEADDGKLTAAKVREQAKKARQQLSNPLNAQAALQGPPQPVRGVNPVDAQGFGSLAAGVSGSDNPVSRAEAGAVGPA